MLTWQYLQIEEEGTRVVQFSKTDWNASSAWKVKPYAPNHTAVRFWYGLGGFCGSRLGSRLLAVWLLKNLRFKLVQFLIYTTDLMFNQNVLSPIFSWTWKSFVVCGNLRKVRLSIKRLQWATRFSAVHVRTCGLRFSNVACGARQKRRTAQNSGTKTKLEIRNYRHVSRKSGSTVVSICLGQFNKANLTCSVSSKPAQLFPQTLNPLLFFQHCH